MMMLVLSSVAGHHFNSAVVSYKGDLESNSVVAGLDVLKVVFRYSCLNGCSVEEKLNLL